MTEAEWLACRDYRHLVECLRGKASDRKFRLVAVACCRKILPFCTSKRSEAAIEAAELFADGQITSSGLKAFYSSANRVCTRVWKVWVAAGQIRYDPAYKVFRAAAAARCVCLYESRGKAFPPADMVANAVWDIQEIVGYKAMEPIFREVMGNPFRPVTIDASWLSWNGGTVPKLSRAIYDERRFSDLPILADALEEAGCDNPDILAHCRSGGEHVRGCWVVDLLLGKS
jgi:hypothetical protein